MLRLGVEELLAALKTLLKAKGRMGVAAYTSSQKPDVL